MNREKSDVKLSICCITYNHEKYIEQTLNSFLMQKTNFKFEVLIHDDASTDKTAEIIHKYEKKFPDIIKPVYQKENQFSKGIYVDKEFNWPRIQGEYVALCEGDDYWTDEYKLQKQVDFLDQNKDYNVCFHPVLTVWDDDSKVDSVYPDEQCRFYKTELTFDDLLIRNFIQTNSVVYRWQLKGKEDTFPNNILPCDYFIHLLNVNNGKIKCLPHVMAVYRKQAGGIWMGCGVTDEWFLRCGLKHINFYDEIEKMFGCNKSEEKMYLAKRCLDIFKKYKDEKQLNEIITKYPNECKPNVANVEQKNSSENVDLQQITFKKRIFIKLIEWRFKIGYWLLVILLIIILWLKPILG